MIIRIIFRLLILTLSLTGCALFDETTPKKPEATGLIATPPSYYSTAKARYLGTRYKDNLDRLVERITRNPKTASLQFANNISSVGGVGFFTHSATRTPDERYLEVVLATPETFEVKGEFSDKVQQLFSRYGTELLGIISADNEMYQDREMSGYGLNLAWRNVVTEPAGNRVTLERSIIYLSKEKARKFLHKEILQNELLADAVIFAVEEDGPLNLVSYRPRETQPDVRSAIREDNLAATTAAAKSVASVAEQPKGAQPAVAPISPATELGAPTTTPLVSSSAAPNSPAQPSQSGDPVKLPVRLPEAATTEIRPPQRLASVDAANPSSSPSVVNSEGPTITAVSPSSSEAALPAPEKSADRLAGERLAVLKNQSVEAAPAKSGAVRPSPKALEGFIIQLAFSDKEKAQRWAESMEKRGFAVSVTEVGTTAGALRVRLGNFAAREEAERQLRTFKQDGLNGIVINLPQAFRPVARTSVP